MILVQPLEQNIIRRNPIYRNDVVIVLESLTKELSLKKEVANAPDGYNVTQAFAWFSNEGHIDKREGWVLLEDYDGLEKFDEIWKEAMQKIQSKDYYYGS